MSKTEFEKLEKVLEENCGKYAEYKELYEMATN